MNKKDFISLYTEFRKEMDVMAIPLICDDFEIIKPITADMKVVGVVAGWTDYIDCVYVLPEYRRKGLAKQAVLDFVESKLNYGIKLHIIKTNETAKRFWHSVFELKEIGTNRVDTLYEIKGVRKMKGGEG